MKVAAIASALALCALTSPALAKPLDARDVHTKTVTETETDIRYRTSTVVKYKTLTETETESIVKTKTKTKTLTETETETRKRTVTETSTTTRVRTQTVPVTTTNVITRTSVSTQSVTFQAPASTVTLKPITTTLTQKGSTSVSTTTLTQKVSPSVSTTTLTQKVSPSVSTTTLTQKGSVVTTYLPASTVIVPTTKQVTVTAKLVSTVVVPSTYTTSLPPQTVTIITSVPGVASTVPVYDTITSWMTAACSSNGTFPTTSAYNATVSVPSVANTTSSVAAATSTLANTYINVITESCSDPKAYYLQVDGTGRKIDGTILVGEPSDNNPGCTWLQPFESPSEYTPSPFTLDSSTGFLRAYSTTYQDFVLSAYNLSSAEYRGAVFSQYADTSYGDNIECTSSSNGDSTYALTCGTTMDGAYHAMDKLVDFQGDRWWAFINGYTFEDYATYGAKFTLVPACDL